MRLDWWMSAPYRKGVVVEDEAEVFQPPRVGKNLLLVESQEEHDLASALQYIHGHEVEIRITPGIDKSEIWVHLDSFRRVYTSWDPFDRNRI